MKTRYLFLSLLIATSFYIQGAPEPTTSKWVPQIDGDWWSVAGMPDLGALTSPQQQPVDFAVWQAADGTWQLWSCIRKTKATGKTRLFHRWEGQKLTDSNWKPMGIAMQADPKLGETEGGLQAPHVILQEGLYWMFYGDWENICSATSKDGKTFNRRILSNGKTGLFTEGLADNTRDAMVVRIGNLWHCYYTAYPNRKGAVYCRTSTNLNDWSVSKIVAFGGQAGDNPYSAECPFVMEYKPGHFFLFRTQRYGKDAKTSVYYSHDPQDFGVNHDEGHFVCILPVAAPEIIQQPDGYYVAALNPGLDGIRIAKLRWVQKE
jgi:hypothetical protein